ncbi:hypothetical protein L218DRAFT_1081353 [Marasmius fiardii PR-910]|nr:hypothetical protein L218DRAFT_1081353 [Marasmius fiardii PR-910]
MSIPVSTFISALSEQDAIIALANSVPPILPPEKPKTPVEPEFERYSFSADVVDRSKLQQKRFLDSHPDVKEHLRAWKLYDEEMAEFPDLLEEWEWERRLFGERVAEKLEKMRERERENWLKQNAKEEIPEPGLRLSSGSNLRKKRKEERGDRQDGGSTCKKTKLDSSGQSNRIPIPRGQKRELLQGTLADRDFEGLWALFEGFYGYDGELGIAGYLGVSCESCQKSEITCEIAGGASTFSCQGCVLGKKRCTFAHCHRNIRGYMRSVVGGGKWKGPIYRREESQRKKETRSTAASRIPGSQGKYEEPEWTAVADELQKLFEEMQQIRVAHGRLTQMVTDVLLIFREEKLYETMRPENRMKMLDVVRSQAVEPYEEKWRAEISGVEEGDEDC